MATTVQSSSRVAWLQRDGRSQVDEFFILSNGTHHHRNYLADAGTDFDAHLTAAGLELLAELGAAEINANVVAIETLGINAAPTLVYSVLADNAAAVRAAYQGATQAQAAFIGEYLNSLSNALLAAAFGITTGQAATLKTNVLAPAATLAGQIRAAAGQ